MTKAELIQASNNIETNTIIYTFKLTYPRNSWWFKIFKTAAPTTCYATGMSLDDILMSVKSTNVATCLLSEQVSDVCSFTRKVFNSLQHGGRLGGSDIQKAKDLFGTRIQDVLKQYNVGEQHTPSDGSPQGILMDHCALAIRDYDRGGHWEGWSRI